MTLSLSPGLKPRHSIKTISELLSLQDSGNSGQTGAS
jgi:hypothetical protein